jgi:hypothetical protein
MQWLADEPRPDFRAAKTTAFLYALHGPSLFSGCTSAIDVCTAQRVPRSSFYYYLGELRAFGLAWGGSTDASNIRRSDRPCVDTQDVAFSEEELTPGR